MTVPRFFDDDTAFAIKIRTSHVEPDYQPGDWVTAREASEAYPGQVVIAESEDGSRSLERWPAEGTRVVGVVTGMFRKVN